MCNILFFLLLSFLSLQTISFHYVEAAEAQVIHSVLSDQAKYRNMTFEQFRATWPRVGGYSRGVAEHDQDTFELLVNKIVV